MRINRASDDAAGLSIASSLRVDSRVYGQAIRNVNDAVSMLNIAEGASQELTNVVLRLSELAQQSANGTLSNTQRSALDAEGQALRSEFNRIISTTDFNGLRLLDGSNTSIAVQLGYGDLGSLNVSLASFLGRMSGDGTFFPPTSFTALSSTNGAAAGDLNGDGNQDIALGAFGSPNSLGVRLGNGDGTFKATVTYVMSQNSVRYMEAVDINLDGRLDMIAGRDSDDRVAVMLGNGDGTFLVERSFYAGDFAGGSAYFRTGDINGDGRPDVVAANQTSSSITTLLANSDGTFSNGVVLSGSTAIDLAVGDINGDNALDIVSANATHTLVFLGNNNGTFLAPVSYSGNAGGAFVGDLNGDGKNDVVSLSGTNVFVRLGNGDGTLTAQTQYATGTAGTVSGALRDVTDDGIVDLVINTNSGINVLLSNGNGTFKLGSTYGSSGSGQVALADFNSDSAFDVLASTFGGTTVSVFLGNGEASSTLAAFNLRTKAGALAAITAFRSSRTSLSSARAELGSSMSRLATANSNLRQLTENIDRAASGILDADIAEESSRLVRLNILQNSAQSILAQANQLPAMVLALLTP